MHVCIHRKKIGTSKHLLVNLDGSEYTWVNDISPDIWTYGSPGSSKDLEHVSRMFKQKLCDVIPIEYKRMMNDVAGTESGICWHSIIPAGIYRKRLSGLVKQCKELTTALSDSGYYEQYCLAQQLLRSFKQGSVSRQKIEEYLRLEKNPTNVSCLKTFYPSSDGLAPEVAYDFYGTSTGRSTIKSGPRILTLPSAYRDILVPSHESKILIQVDFVSLEPRVALSVNMNKAEPINCDIYEQINHTLFDNALTRAQVKLATLCALYGASASRLSGISSSLNSKDIVHKIKKYFGVYSLTNSLKLRLKQQGFLQNYYGRPLFFEDLDDYRIYNHYVQSTSCDIAVRGFYNLLKTCSNHKVSVTPLYIIHDAMLVEIEKNSLGIFSEISSQGIKISNLGNFPISLETMPGNNPN